jgi:hypothetical protein
MDVKDYKYFAVAPVVLEYSFTMVDPEATGDDIQAAGWARVPERLGWKPAAKVCLHCIVTYGMLSVQFIY